MGSFLNVLWRLSLSKSNLRSRSKHTNYIIQHEKYHNSVERLHFLVNYSALAYDNVCSFLGDLVRLTLKINLNLISSENQIAYLH